MNQNSFKGEISDEEYVFIEDGKFEPTQNNNVNKTKKVPYSSKVQKTKYLEVPKVDYYEDNSNSNQDNTDDQDYCDEEDHDDKDELYNDKKIKSKRRSRKEPAKRDFSCKCGKTYLSHPALYTHIKTKHNSDQKKYAVSRRDVSPKANRGRPTKQQAGKNSPPEALDKSDVDMWSNIDENDANDEILHFFFTIEQKLTQNPSNNQSKILKGIAEGELDVIAEYPEKLKSDSIFKILKKIYVKPDQLLLDNPVKKENQTYVYEESLEKPEIKIKKVTLNEIFANFIWKIGKDLQTQSYKELVIFVHGIKQTFEKLGLELLKQRLQEDSIGEIDQIIESKPSDKEFCEWFNGELIPYMANHVYDFLKNKDEPLLELIRPENRIILKEENLISIIKQFCDWAYSFKFSICNLNLGEEN